MELPKTYEYIVTIARTNNLKEPVHYVTGAKTYEQALSMMSAAGSTLRFCQEENALTEYDSHA